ncbi:hypothetical protein P2318_20560 [Myxococcaceae bacterium GXIMD 01537]
MIRPMDARRLTFFCELDAPALQALFDEPGVLEDVRALEAGISLGLIDLSPERAAVVRRLNAAGIPVMAWLLLPPEQGYWLHLGNAPQAEARYGEFLAWTRAHGLRWAGVGLDIEPDLRDFQRAFSEGWLRLLPSVPGRLLSGGRLRRARETYGALVERIRADGYPVESYQFPLIVDEREAGSTLWQRLSGVLDLSVDREVLMLYTSFVRPLGPAYLWSYLARARAAAVGITGGGVPLPPGVDARPLTWEELSRDLRLARRWCNDLYVFSLEGCVRAGFLQRLRELDWDAHVEPPEQEALRVDAARRAAVRALRGSTHPARIPGGLVGLGVLLLSLGRLRAGRSR